MNNHNSNKTAKFTSLKVKWAFGTALGSLIITLIVIICLCTAVTSDLMSQEQTLLNDSLTTISRKLSASLPNGRLSSGDVRSSLQKERLTRYPNSARQGRFYHESALQGLTNSHQNIAIFDSDGRQVFSTGHITQHYQKVQSKKIITVHPRSSHRMLVGRMPLTKNSGSKVVGYLQIENPLNNYYDHLHRIILVSSLSLALVVILSGLLGYFLSYLLLRPLTDIRNTIEDVTDDPTKNIRVPDTNRHDELGELSSLLNEMLDRTQRYIDQQSQFVGDVSHELRTPVAIIQGHMEMLDRWGKDDPKVLEESIKAALAETSRMNNLIKEMLDLSRAEQVEINFRNEKTAVQKLVNQVYNDFQMIHPDFNFSLDDDLRNDVTVQIHRDHLEQILIILLDNAVKYSGDHREIHLSLSRNYNAVEIAVQDFGEGIPEEDIGKVFDRFYRVDKARSRKKGGNGLGLSIAKRLVEGYHGTITVESKLHYGSIFRITLPIDKNDLPKHAL